MMVVFITGWVVLTWLGKETGSGSILENQFQILFGIEVKFQVCKYILRLICYYEIIAGEPNNGVGYNCMYLASSTGRAADIPCDIVTNINPLCQIPQDKIQFETVRLLDVFKS